MRSTVPVVLLALVCAATGSATTCTPGGGATLEQLVGQRLVVALRGTTASASILARVRSGQVGGVILFGANIRSIRQVGALTQSLRAAARAGGRPALLISVDQEGGSIRRFASLPPSRSAAQLGQGSLARVRASGKATAEALRALGVNVDLAPVADVPSVSGSFIAAQARAFSADPRRVAADATAFALGLADGGVAATAKHFPGLGRATVSTDAAAVMLTSTRPQLETDVLPYRSLIGSGVPLVMVSNAAYSALDGKPATWSPAVQALLRRTLRFAGVTITDSLDAAGPTHHRSVTSAAVLAAQAGNDLLLVTGSEAESAAVYERLLAAAEAGKLPEQNLQRSYARIVALKRGL